MRHCKKHNSSIQGSFGVGLNEIWVTVGQCHNRFATQLTKRNMVTVIILQNNLNRTETGLHFLRICIVSWNAEVPATLTKEKSDLKLCSSCLGKTSSLWPVYELSIQLKHELHPRTSFVYGRSMSNIPPVTIQNLHLQQAGKVAGGLKCYVENMAKHCEPHHFSRQNWSMKSKSTYIFPHWLIPLGHHSVSSRPPTAKNNTAVVATQKGP